MSRVSSCRRRLLRAPPTWSRNRQHPVPQNLSSNRLPLPARKLQRRRLRPRQIHLRALLLLLLSRHRQKYLPTSLLRPTRRLRLYSQRRGRERKSTSSLPLSNRSPMSWSLLWSWSLLRSWSPLTWSPRQRHIRGLMAVLLDICRLMTCQCPLCSQHPTRRRPRLLRQSRLWKSLLLTHRTFHHQAPTQSSAPGPSVYHRTRLATCQPPTLARAQVQAPAHCYRPLHPRARL